MAIAFITLGSEVNAIGYDDAVFTKSAVVPAPISCTGTPVDVDDLVKINDVSTVYFVLLGSIGGQIAYGGTDSGDDLEFHSTYHATKGLINLGDALVIDEENVTITIPSLTAGNIPYISVGGLILEETPVADGTYTVGKGAATDGTITITNGIITAIQEASDV